MMGFLFLFYYFFFFIYNGDVFTQPCNAQLLGMHQGEYLVVCNDRVKDNG